MRKAHSFFFYPKVERARVTSCFSYFPKFQTNLNFWQYQIENSFTLAKSKAYLTVKIYNLSKNVILICFYDFVHFCAG